MNKKIKTLSIIFLTAVLLSSCGFHSSIGNINNNTTIVELSTSNFEVLKKVSGESTATYVLGLGGISNKALIENAKSNMLDNANIIGGSRAIINLTTEQHISIVFPLFYRKTITASGYVVEFVEKEE